MGMFDFDLDQVQVSNTPYGYTSVPMQLAYAGGGGMVTAAGKLAGFQTEEDMLKEIYENTDFSTLEGRQAAVDAVMQINPEEGRKLQKQLNEAAQSEAATSQITLNTQNQQIEHLIKFKGNSYAREFERDAGAGGMEVAIRYYLDQNGITYNASKPPKTLTEAKILIRKKMKDTNDIKSHQKGIETYVGQQQTYFINKRAIEDAEIELGRTVDSSVANNFDTAISDGSVASPPPDTTEEPLEKSFKYVAPDGKVYTDPKTAPQGEPFRGEHNGIAGTWVYEWIGGQYSEGHGVWKHKKDVTSQYTGESKYSVGGQSFTADEMFANFDY